MCNIIFGLKNTQELLAGNMMEMVCVCVGGGGDQHLNDIIIVCAGEVYFGDVVMN